MSTLTIRLPDDKHERLKALAKSNSISINKLMDELATVALANYDARVRFAAMNWFTETPSRAANCLMRGYTESSTQMVKAVMGGHHSGRPAQSLVWPRQPQLCHHGESGASLGLSNIAGAAEQLIWQLQGLRSGVAAHA